MKVDEFCRSFASSFQLILNFHEKQQKIKNQLLLKTPLARREDLGPGALVHAHQTPWMPNEESQYWYCI